MTLIGFSATNASAAARKFAVAEAMNTACQPPAWVAQTLASGTTIAAVPLAVYMRPVFTVANFAPKVSVVVAGKRL